MALHWGEADEMPVSSHREQGMFIQSYHQDRLACALGALTFAGLAFAAALYPLI